MPSPAPAPRPDDGEPAAQLVALKDQLEFAVPQCLAWIRGRLRLKGPPVPNDHISPAVLAGGNRAFEIEVVERMILDVECGSLDVGVEARSLGHSPADQYAIDLQPKIVVEAAGAVPLDDEPATHCRDRAEAGSRIRAVVWASVRLRSPVEVPLSSILLEAHRRRLDRRVPLGRYGPTDGPIRRTDASTGLDVQKLCGFGQTAETGRVAIATFSLSKVHGRVCGPEERVSILAVVRIEADADAHGHLQGVALQ